MADLVFEPVGTVTDAYGDEFEIGIQWDQAADPAEDAEPEICIDQIVLTQEAAEAFAQIFVSACWEAGRKYAEMQNAPRPVADKTKAAKETPQP